MRVDVGSRLPATVTPMVSMMQRFAAWRTLPGMPRIETAFAQSASALAIGISSMKKPFRQISFKACNPRPSPPPEGGLDLGYHVCFNKINNVKRSFQHGLLDRQRRLDRAV